MQMNSPCSKRYKEIRPAEVIVSGDDCASLDKMLLTRSMPTTPVSLSLNMNNIDGQSNISDMFCNGG
jgi:hypothetical protein